MGNGEPANKVQKNVPKSIPNPQKWVPKSMKKRGGVPEASWGRCGGPKWLAHLCEMGPFWSQFGNIFVNKINKYIQKCIQKSMQDKYRIWMPKGSQSQGSEPPLWRPRPRQKRIRDATSIFHRFCIDFGSHFGDILLILAPFWAHFKRQRRQFLPGSRIESPQPKPTTHHESPYLKWPIILGCGGDALRLE